jgi:hypothetical protein
MQSLVLRCSRFAVKHSDATLVTTCGIIVADVIAAGLPSLPKETGFIRVEALTQEDDYFHGVPPPLFAEMQQMQNENPEFAALIA